MKPGHAILAYAVTAPFRFNEELERKDCGSNGRETARCSRTLSGSPGAIHEGVGDTVTLFLFPDSTPIGELFWNRPSGLDHCGLPRDVSQIKAQGLTAQDLFDACSDYGCLERFTLSVRFIARSGMVFFKGPWIEVGRRRGKKPIPCFLSI